MKYEVKIYPKYQKVDKVFTCEPEEVPNHVYKTVQVLPVGGRIIIKRIE